MWKILHKFVSDLLTTLIRVHELIDIIIYKTK